ncbi:MAG: tsf [Clostridia bacterium]|nr:tsf [Clostridia bacterium]
MANITAKEVQALRERTGVGMMDCKRALVATDGDMEKATDFLREKGLAAAAKKSSRIAAEGAIAIYNQNNVAVLVEVNAETDFVAKNEKFKTFADNIAALIAAKNPADVNVLLASDYDGSGKTVEDMRKEMILVIGENMNIRRFVRIEGNVFTYNHGFGKIGVITKFEADSAVAAKEDFAIFGKDICMQIAALNPQYLDRASVPAEVIEKEKSILMAQIKNDPKLASKPDAVIEKMIVGRLNKFYEQNCLLDQIYFKDEALTVGKYIESKAIEYSSALKVSSFVRFEKGEGLQKREDNFADEVANMTK